MATWKPQLITDDTPRYIALADALQRDIRSGRVKPGQRMPSHRDLAASLGVDVTTVSRGYAEARRRGLIAGLPGRGTFVRQAITGRATHSDEVADLATNTPPEPCEVFDTAFTQSLSRLGNDAGVERLFTFQPQPGIRQHREAGAAWCSELGVPSDAARVMLCAGTQQALLGILGTHCRPGDTVLTEALSYPGFLAAARLFRLRVVGVPMDEQGVDPRALKRCIRAVRPKALLLTPTLHSPTAITTNNTRRAAIAAVAKAEGVVIVEDMTYGGLVERAPKPMAVFAPEHTYTIVTLSKAVSPVFRLAYLVAPRAATVETLLPNIRATGWMSSAILAEIASFWIADGTMADVRDDRRAECAARQEIANQFLGPSGRPPEGLHRWMALPRRWSGGRFVQAAQRRNILIRPGSAFAVAPGLGESHVRISLGAPPTHAILARALETLATLMSLDAEDDRADF
jgi:DNA-binding transcriptional MocR family regulator